MVGSWNINNGVLPIAKDIKIVEIVFSNGTNNNVTSLILWSVPGYRL
jgi:hypothetical protein